MNDRIQQLAEQAGLYASRETTDLDEWQFIRDEKFSELLIGECISKYDEWAEHSTDKTSFHMAQHNIKKHFGVGK